MSHETLEERARRERESVEAEELKNADRISSLTLATNVAAQVRPFAAVERRPSSTPPPPFCGVCGVGVAAEHAQRHAGALLCRSCDAEGER